MDPINNLLQAGEKVSQVAFGSGSYSYGIAATDRGRIITWGNTNPPYGAPVVSNNASGTAFSSGAMPPAPNDAYLNWNEDSLTTEGLRYSYKVTNTSSVLLENVTPSTPETPEGFTCSFDKGAMDIAAGETITWDWDCYPSKEVFLKGDIVQSSLPALEATFTTAFESAPLAITGTATPRFNQVNIYGSAYVTETMTATANPITLGSTVTITTTITNSGTTPLTINGADITRSIDEKVGGSNKVTASNQSDNTKLVLALGATGTFTTTFVADGELLRSTPLINTTVVSGHPEDCLEGSPCEAVALGTVNSQMNATVTGIDFRNTSNLPVTVTFTPSNGWEVGSTIVATTSVRNIGVGTVANLNDIKVTDSSGRFVFTCAIGASTLAVNATTNCTSAPYTLTLADAQSDSIDFLFEASGKLASSSTNLSRVTATKEINQAIEQYTTGALLTASGSISHNGSVATMLSPEDTLTITAIATNSGTATWSNVFLTDTLGIDFTCRLTDDNGAIINESTVVPAGATVWCQAALTAAAGHVNSGSLTELVTLHYTPEHGTELTVDAQELVFETVAVHKSLTISKPVVTIDDMVISEGGTLEKYKPVTFKYTVTNDGNVTVNNLKVTVSDQGLTPLCEDSTLSPGESTLCTASKTFG